MSIKKIIFSLLIFMLIFSSAAAAQEILTMATTTSTENSGLLAELIPPFEEKFNVRVDVVAVGTGAAIELGRNGDADIIFVHAREAEDEFVANSYGVNRRDVMYNDFVILGPTSDPAGLRDTENAAEALEKIAASKTEFVSRGDNSGTHKKELSLWDSAGIKPDGSWYLESGQGMGPSINMADERQAYILADRGTFLAYSGDIELEILNSGDPALFNPYGIIPINPAYHTHVNYQMAMAFTGYVTSQQGQNLINNYMRYGKQLFYPSAIEEDNLVD
ncbi:ABC-type tungstate transport system, periplasmic binding protein [Halanaerobium saccharolyticum subsp. saccharolyticum DSM 6643]|uniref:ABC-type tungstate transport system, periplasmic binding protein n=1 Tax=Halanaerobium saccharolyticum subsp. saccharolyticum DSM 6643 TaxID=1293054 RepID=M5E1L2_9FIRM|nr:substrate-binding domain-containing protein [Halanaerobium saccharolyticum]CCU79822.1 ABC-type tungstate transport system, periplasmic binding protein [Halanaerobium saccharolyticum subsp. saccharolyticum DSM 6643]